MRSTGDRCWQEARSVYPRLMELFYRGSTSQDGQYFIFARTSRMGIIFPRQRQEKRDRTKWNPSLWTRHVRQELRNDRDFARGRFDEKDWWKGREGTARDTQRPVGIICTSLGWRWLGLVATCAMTVVLCTDRAQSICRRTRDYEFFPTNTRFTTNTPPLHLFLLNNSTSGI